MITALIFDCFGVFYPDPVFAYMLDPKTPKNKAVALHGLDDQAAHGNLSKIEFVGQAAKLLGDNTSAIEKRFFHGQINKELVDFVMQVKQQYKTALLSNIGGDMMSGFFSQSDYDKLFNTVILSGDVGLVKPDPNIFKLVCKKLGVRLDEVVVIDDTQENIDIAESIGMSGILFRSFRQFSFELEAL